MVTLKVRMYEGKELHYTKDGKVQNKSQVSKMSEFHFIQKFLKYCNTLSNLIVLEEVYDAVYVSKGQSKCVAVPQEVFDKYLAMLNNVGVETTTLNPIEEENKVLKDRDDLNKKELAEMRREMAEIRKLIPEKIEVAEEPKEAKASSIPEPVPPPKELKDMTKKELTEEARKAGIQLKGNETRAIIINKLS